MKTIDMHRHNGDPEEVEKSRALWDSLGYTHVCHSGSLSVARDMMKRYPGYAIGFAYVKMDDGPWDWRNDELGRTRAIAVDEIDRYKDEGFKGLKVIFTREPYSHDRYLPYYERAQQIGLPVLFHTGWVSGGAPQCRRVQENYRPVYLQTIAGLFPDLKILCAHLGGWQFSQEAVIAMWKHPNVYADLCGYTMYRFPTSHFRQLFCNVPPAHPEAEPVLNTDIFGKLVYGTDNDDEGIHAFYQRLMQDLDVPQDIQEKIYYQNMAEILGV